MKRRKNVLANFIQSKKTFLGMFISVACCTILSVLVLSSLLASAFNKLETENSKESAESSFRQINGVVDSMEANSHATSVMIMQESNCENILSATRNPSTPGESLKRKATQYLFLYQTMFPYIDSIYVYNRPTGAIITDSFSFDLQQEQLSTGKSGFNDLEILELLENYSEIQNQMPIKRTIKAYKSGYSAEKTVLTYIYPYFEKEGTVESAVVVNIPLLWLIDNMQGLPDMEHSALRLLHGNGDVILDYSKNSDFVWESAEIPPFSDESDGIRFTEYTQNTKKYQVLYHAENDWEYYRVRDWEYAYQGVLAITKTSQRIVSIIVLCSILGCVLVAISIYRTYSKVERQNKKLVDEGRIHLLRSRDSFLFSLITGYSSMTHTKIDKKMKEYNLPYTEDHPVSLLALKIEKHQSHLNKMGHDNMVVFEYGICNIFEEIASRYYHCTGVQTGGNHILFIISPKTDEKIELTELLEEFEKDISGFINWKFFLISAEQWGTMRELGELRNELIQVLSDSFFYPSFTHLSLAEAKKRQNSILNYPSEIEKKILNSLRLGNVQETKELYSKFEEKVYDNRYSNCMTAYAMLAFQVLNIVPALSNDETRYGDLLLSIRRAEKMEDAKELFSDVFEEIQSLIEQNSSRSDPLQRVQEIEAFIRANYCDPNLTPQMIAEHFHLSSDYLRRQFKDVKKLSLSDYINKVKIENVAHNLLTTDTPAKKLASDVGFTNTNYFYTLFKKTYGLTPQNYRTKTKNANNDFSSEAE